MEHPIRVAFCKLLFARNGGQFNERGMPVSREAAVRGRCDRGWDCCDCVLMQEWLASLQAQGWVIGWECDACLKETEDEKQRPDMERHVEGYYQSGRRRDLLPDDSNYDPDRPILEGCTRCGWESSFLQLVLRRAK